MELVPTQDEVLALLRETGALQQRALRVPQRPSYGHQPGNGAGHALSPPRQNAQRGSEPQAARQFRTARDHPRAFDRFRHPGGPAGGLRAVRSTARRPGLLGRKGRPRRADALPPVSGAGSRREGRPGGRSAAVRHAAAPRRASCWNRAAPRWWRWLSWSISRRRKPAISDHCRSITWRSWTPATTPMPARASFAAAMCRSTGWASRGMCRNTRSLLPQALSRLRRKHEYSRIDQRGPESL